MSIAHEVDFPDQERLPPTDKDAIYEIIDDQAVEKQMGAESDLIAGNLLYLIKSFATNGRGWCFPGTTGYQVFKDRPRRIRLPDVSFIRSGRLPGDKPPRGYLQIVPDLIAEIISPNDNAEDVEQRLDEFLTAGVPLAWMVYPPTRHVYVYHQGTSALRLGPDDVLDGEDVLPGFSCPVSEIFASL